MICSVKIQSKNMKMIWNISLFPFRMIAIFLNARCLHARQPGAISPKPLCPAVIMRMREIFLLQNKYRVGKVCKNRCPAVDLAIFYRKISAACVLILPGI